MIALLQEEGRNTWYPTIIGDAGDRWCGQRARLYYGSMTSEGFHDRKFLGRDIVFFRPGEPGMVHSSLRLCHPTQPICASAPDGSRPHAFIHRQVFWIWQC